MGPKPDRRGQACHLPAAAAGIVHITGVAGDRPSQDAAAFSALAARGAAVSRELDARSLALLSWAFAASRRGDRSLAPRGEDTLFEALEAHAIPRLARGLGARDSAALAWSLERPPIRYSRTESGTPVTPARWATDKRPRSASAPCG